MFFASKHVLDEIVKCINLPMDCDNIIVAKYPVFRNIVCPRVRSLIAVSVGCNVNLFPITTPKETYEYVSSDKEFIGAMYNTNYDNAYLALKKFVMLQYKLKIKKNPSQIEQKNNQQYRSSRRKQV